MCKTRDDKPYGTYLFSIFTPGVTPVERKAEESVAVAINVPGTANFQSAVNIDTERLKYPLMAVPLTRMVNVPQSYLKATVCPLLT